MYITCLTDWKLHVCFPISWASCLCRASPPVLSTNSVDHQMSAASVSFPSCRRLHVYSLISFILFFCIFSFWFPFPTFPIHSLTHSLAIIVLFFPFTHVTHFFMSVIHLFVLILFFLLSPPLFLSPSLLLSSLLPSFTYWVSLVSICFSVCLITSPSVVLFFFFLFLFSFCFVCFLFFVFFSHCCRGLFFSGALLQIHHTALCSCPRDERGIERKRERDRDKKWEG